MGRLSKIGEIEAQQKRPIVEILQDAFERHGTKKAVADSLGVGQATIAMWLLRLNLTTKTVLVPTADNNGQQQQKAAPTPDKSSAA